MQAKQAIGPGAISVAVTGLGETFTEKTDITVRPAASLQKTTQAGAVAGGCLLLVLVAALKDSSEHDKLLEMGEGSIGLIRNLGKELFSTYVVPFEISSILFLSAMVGAVVIGKKD
mgnify:CR=1 FL=1